MVHYWFHDFKFTAKTNYWLIVLCFKVTAGFQLGRAGDIVEQAIENCSDLPNQYAQANTRKC